MARIHVAVHTRVRVRVGAGGASIGVAAAVFVAVMIAMSPAEGEARSTTIAPAPDPAASARASRGGTSGLLRPVVPPSGDIVRRSRATVSCTVPGDGTLVRLVNTSSARRNFRVLVDHRVEGGRFLSNDVATFRSVEPGEAVNVTVATPQPSHNVFCRVRAVSDF